MVVGMGMGLGLGLGLVPVLGNGNESSESRGGTCASHGHGDVFQSAARTGHDATLFGQAFKESAARLLEREKRMK